MERKKGKEITPEMTVEKKMRIKRLTPETCKIQRHLFVCEYNKAKNMRVGY